MSSRGGSQLVGSIVLFAVLVGGGLIYGAGGPPTRDIFVTQMLINAVMVIGLQIYIGNTGVLSFGHMGFAAIAGFTFVILAMSPERKERLIPDAPFGLTDVSVDPLVAVVIALAVTLFVGLIVGLGLARSGAKSGAVAATIITLALLFVVHEVANSYADLTGGRNGLSFAVGQKLDGRTWIYVALFLAIVAARFFKGSRTGRMAQAAREDDLAARAMGINPTRGQLIALLLSLVVVSVAASLRSYQLGTVAPSTFFFDYTLVALVMLIVGGRNSIAGSVVGVALVTAANEATRYVASDNFDAGPFDFVLREGLSDLVLGGAMLGLMIYRSKGLIEDWEVDDWLRRRFGRRELPPDPPPVRELADEHRLTASDVSVHFGGVPALRDAQLEATSREVVGLIGPNGAGKTTLVNVITGLVEPTSGTCVLDGTELIGLPSFEIARSGLARTFQNLRLFPAFTVRENVEIVAVVAAAHRADGARPSADQLLVQAGLWDHRDRRARELDYGNARRLELARAAALAPTFIVLDEPTSGMSDNESLAMIDQVRGMAALAGAGVIVIDHDLGFITGICNRIYCLDQGEVIAVGTPAEIQADPKVQAAYLGSAAPA
jgi:branched-chain amino acid transport system permease protein